MPFKKGDPNIVPGRPAGVPNKVTTEIRKAYEMLLYANIPQMSEWLNQVAQEDPEKAVTPALNEIQIIKSSFIWSLNHGEQATQTPLFRHRFHLYPGVYLPQ